MMSALLWPLAVVLFDAIVFLIALFLVRLAARDHLLEERRLQEMQQQALEEEVAHEPATLTALEAAPVQPERSEQELSPIG